MDNQKYYKMDYEESEEFICIACNWNNAVYLAFFDDCINHFLEMNLESREEIKYLQNSYEFKKWYSIYFSRRNQHIVEEVISWNIEQNCWVFKEQMGTHIATYKARNSAAFTTYYSYFMKDYSNVEFDKEHYLRNFKAPVTQDSEVVKQVEEIVNISSKKKTTQKSIWDQIFAHLMSFII